MFEDSLVESSGRLDGSASVDDGGFIPDVRASR